MGVQFCRGVISFVVDDDDVQCVHPVLQKREKMLETLHTNYANDDAGSWFYTEADSSRSSWRMFNRLRASIQYKQDFFVSLMFSHYTEHSLSPQTCFPPRTETEFFQTIKCCGLRAEKMWFPKPNRSIILHEDVK